MSIGHYCVYDSKRNMFLELCYVEEDSTKIVGRWLDEFTYKRGSYAARPETVWELEDDLDDPKTHDIFNSLIELGCTEFGKYDLKYLESILLVPVEDMVPTFMKANYFADRIEV